MNFVLLGAPGAGKGTLAGKMCEAYGLSHISTGDMLRENMRLETALGKEARSLVDAGKLVPDALIVAMVRERLTQEGAKGYLFDGFPRTTAQADALLEIAPLERVLYLEVPVEALVKRLSGRLVCKGCGAVYHSSWLEAGESVCRKCGGALYTRDDDKSETVKKRVEVYNENTAPLISYYREKGLLLTIDGQGSPEEVFAAVKAALGISL